MWRNPIPWKKTALTPNLGGTDETDDMRPGLGYDGLMKLQQFVKNGGVSKVNVALKAGEYTFYCSVPGHREGGMEGKLTVK